MTTLQIYLLASAALYLLPLFVAMKRQHRQVLAIGMLNLLLGWTAIGWIVALVWSCTADIREQSSIELNIRRQQRMRLASFLLGFAFLAFGAASLFLHQKPQAESSSPAAAKYRADYDAGMAAIGKRN